MKTLEAVKQEVRKWLSGAGEYAGVNGVSLFELDMDEQARKIQALEDRVEELQWQVGQLESDKTDLELDLAQCEQREIDLQGAQDGES